MLWLNGGWLPVSSTSLYMVLGGLLLTEELTPDLWSRFRVTRLRYAAVLIGAWLSGVELSPVAWMTVAPAAYLPALQFGDNLLIVLLPLLGFAGFLLGAPPGIPGLELAIFSLAVTFVTALLAREALSLAARRTAAEEELRRSEATYQEIFDAVDEGIMLLDPETGGILQVNEPAGRIFGCSRQSLEMSAVWQLAPNARSQLEAALKGGVSTIQELEAQRSDGTPFWAEILVQQSPVGREHRTILVLRDIEERRRLESQAQLSQKMEAIGNLAGGVAHDFNNLLTVINGQAELAIAAARAGADLRASLQDIHSAGLRAARLVEQLLAYSRKQMLQLRPVDLSELIAGLQPRLSGAVAEGIKQEYRYSGETATVLADVRQIEQVLTNLVSNASDAMPTGGTLRITVRNRSLSERDILESTELQPGRYVEVRVSDTGKGMDEKTLARAFDPFFTTQEFGRGAGLGLSTVYGIVRQHSGGIRVESTPGKGTTFSVFLPCAEGT